MALFLEGIEATAKSEAVAQAMIDKVDEFINIIGNVALQYTRTLSSAMSRIILVMSGGPVVALLVSLAFGLLVTRSLVRAIEAVIASLSKSAYEIEQSSKRLTKYAGALSGGTTENANNLQDTSSSLEEVSSMTKRNADNALEAKTLMGQATDIVAQADGSMAKVTEAMDEISRSGNEIGKIIKTIDEIAFQTNLLALNAAVEAARAGEAGAGFAVVADEVRNLAIRSAEAAKNTADLIEATIKNINSGSDMVNATAEAFKVVETNAAKVGSLVSEVAAASKEQSQGITQITKAMSEMDKVTQANAATAEESASAAAQLSQQANNLLQVVNEINVLAHGTGGRAQSQGAAAQPRLNAPTPPPPAMPMPPRPPAGNQASEANKAMPMDDSFDF